MKILMIESGNAREDPFAQCWYSPERRRFATPLLALPVVAAMTPEHNEIRIIDEKIRDVPLDADCDLVCLSFKTKDAKRSYGYAEAFRRRGVPVILGGVHVTSRPDEAASCADAVVIGEAEGIWPNVIEDFERGNLKKVYRAPRGVDLENAPVPRFDLLDNEKYFLHSIQTSRGCLVGCDFCPIHKMHGAQARHKSVARVMEEVEAVRALDATKRIFFVDEMFCGGDVAYQKDLLAALRRAKVEFLCITDFKVISPEYVRDLARSGCRMLSINMPGTCLPQERKAVRAIQRLGIDVWGFFMFGFSFHDESVFNRVVNFVGESGMKNLTLTVMSPFPNTPMDQRTEARGAHLSRDWDLYDQCHVTFEPERMSARTLERGFHWAWEQLEPHMHFREDQGTCGERQRRALRRAWGTATLGLEHGLRRLLGVKDEPVDLERLLGKPKAEVSVTTHDTMRESHARY